MLSMKAYANEKHTKLDNKTFILFILLLSYLVNFTACFFFNFKKKFSFTQKVNLKINEFNCEKADMFISWHSIINDTTEFSTHQ